MAFCINCGQQIEASANFCNACGKRVSGAVDSVTSTVATAGTAVETVSASAPESSAANEEKNWLLRHPVLAIWLAIIVIIAVCGLVFESSGSRNNEGLGVNDPAAIQAIQHRAVADFDVPANGVWRSGPNLLNCPLDKFNCAEVTYRVSTMNGGDAKEVEAKWIVAFKKSNEKVGFIQTMTPLARAGFSYPGLLNKEDIYATPEDLASDEDHGNATSPASVPQVPPAIDLDANTASMRPRPTPYQSRASDVSLANSIFEQLQHSPNLKTAKINVVAENGRVTLTGTVDTAANRVEAADIAAAVPGVNIITNSLVAQAAETSPASQSGPTNASSPAQQPAPVPQTASTWTDPHTGLMWARQDNGSDVNWNQASNYCRNLTLAGYSNWRLATIDEFTDIYDQTPNVNGSHVKGAIRLTACCPWSSSEVSNYGVRARRSSSFQEVKAHQSFSFLHGRRLSFDIGGFSNVPRALCVRP